MLLILAIAFIVSYSLENTRTRHQLVSDARKLNAVISEPIDYVNALSMYMGKKISDNNKYEDLKYIDALFKETLIYRGSTNKSISWPMFSWGDKKHRLAVNTMEGISKTKQSLASRGYSWRARYEPWELQFSKPISGMISKTWVLPVALGIANSRDEFKGTIITGINIKEMITRAESVLNSGNSFILVNRDPFNQDMDKIILSSSNAPHFSQDYKRIPRIVEKCRDWMEQSGTMAQYIKAGRYKYTYYSMISGHPLVIFVGFNRITFWVNVLSAMVNYTIFAMAILLLGREVLTKK